MPGKILRLLTANMSTRRRTGRRAKPVKPSHANELWYKMKLRALVSHASSAVETRILPMLRASATITTDSSLEDRINAELAKMAEQFGGLDAMARRLAAEAVQKNLQAVDKSLARNLKSAVGIDVSRLMTMTENLAEAMRVATTANVELIKSIPSQYFDRIKSEVADNVAGGFRYEDLRDKLKGVADMTDRRANLIARDQTSKMNSSFNEARQTSLGIDSYIWQTSGDERVRDDHAAHDGQVYRWDSPPSDTGHPGEDIQCRCVAIPYFNL